MSEALHSYVNLVSGLTRTTRARAQAVADAVLAQAGLTEVATDATERVNKLAEEILNAGRANRELLQNLVAAEVEKVVSRLGLARADEVAALSEEVAALRARLAVAEHARSTGAPPPQKAPPRKAPPRKRSAPGTAAPQPPAAPGTDV